MAPESHRSRRQHRPFEKKHRMLFLGEFRGVASCSFLHQKKSLPYEMYIYATPPEKSTVFMGVVRANSRKIFEVEHKFSQHNCFC